MSETQPMTVIGVLAEPTSTVSPTCTPKASRLRSARAWSAASCHVGGHRVDRELEGGDRQVHQVALARHLAADEGDPDATGGGDAGDGLDLRPHVGVDAGAQQRVLGVGGVDDELARLGAEQAGGADEEPVEQAAEEQQQHRQQHQRRAGDGEPQRLAAQLDETELHARPPAFWRFITSAGSMRPTRRSVNSEPTSDSSTTADRGDDHRAPARARRAARRTRPSPRRR